MPSLQGEWCETVRDCSKLLFELALIGGIVFMVASRPAPALLRQQWDNPLRPDFQEVVALTYDDGPHLIIPVDPGDSRQCHVKAHPL